MIITQTPFRMSFFGGGTDMESFFKEYGGSVLSATFDKYCYVNVRHLPRFFDYSTELSYSKTERVTDINDIQHPAIRNAMKMLDMHEIRLTYDNIMPHKKYFYAMQEFPNDIIITFDDDVVYSPFTISSLIKTHFAFPECVCARRVHRIIFEDGVMIPYNKWEFNCTSLKKPSYMLFATGIGGVLYPPNSLYKCALDIERVKNECLRADDVWLKVMEMLAETKVTWTRCLLIVPPDVKQNQSIGLAQGNVNRNQNDIYMMELEEKYHYMRTIRESYVESQEK